MTKDPTKLETLVASYRDPIQGQHLDYIILDDPLDMNTHRSTGRTFTLQLKHGVDAWTRQLAASMCVLEVDHYERVEKELREVISRQQAQIATLKAHHNNAPVGVQPSVISYRELVHQEVHEALNVELMEGVYVGVPDGQDSPDQDQAKVPDDNQPTPKADPRSTKDPSKLDTDKLRAVVNKWFKGTRDY